MARYMQTASATSRSLRSASNSLYTAARVTNDLSALASGNPARIANRAKNRLIMRAIARTGVFRWPL